MLRRLDDRVLGDRGRGRGMTERQAKRLGNAFVALGMVLMLVDYFSEGSLAGGALLFGLSGGLMLGRASEAEQRRRGSGLIDG